MFGGGWGGGGEEGRDSSKSPGWGSAFVVLAIEKNISSEPSPCTLAGDTRADPAMPLPSPA